MKLVILDRDGVINYDSPDYIKSAAEWQPIPGSLKAIAQLCQAGYQVYIASNQSGIGRGLFDHDALSAIHDRMQRELAALGGRIAGIEYAPEAPEHATERRKPAPGMLNDIAKQLGVSLQGVPFVGDSETDVQAAIAAGARPVLVRSGPKKVREIEGVEVHNDLAEFVRCFLACPHPEK
jgi:D-glycero-D-manno-heptose 1,7-bisphosphate phosphatase